MLIPGPIQRHLDRLSLYREWYLQRELRQLAVWQAAGQSGPTPHILKRSKIENLARQAGARVFIETGTYRGDMIQAMQSNFDELHSVELSERLFRRAQNRLAGNPKITLHLGDSAVVLSDILTNLEGPAMLWLDAHYSGGFTARGDLDSPVVDELKAIARNGCAQHLILVDDARCFDGTGGYPTMNELRVMVGSLFPTHGFHCQDDVIEILPKKI